jgi:predicted TPR repeat methyltransferase
MAEMTLEQAFERAVRHHQAGEVAQAEGLYQFILKAEPEEPAVLHLLGLIKAQRGETDEALKLIREAIEILPDVAEFHANLAGILESLGRGDEAVAAYEKAIALKPDAADVHFKIGVLLQALGRADEALAAYARSIELKSDFAPAHNNLGTLYSSRGQLETAERWFRSALALDPNHAAAQSNLAGSLAMLGRMTEAAAAYRRSVVLSPGSAEDHVALGRVLETLGETAEAIGSYRKALTLTPGDGQVKQLLANALWTSGHAHEALAVATEAAAAAPDSYDAQYGLALALERAGRKTEALDAFKRAASLADDPDRVQFEIAALGEGESPPSAPADYVVGLFDGFSAQFDQHMVGKLKYDVPRQLFEAVRPFLGGEKLDVADLGCGTGLSGVPFRPLAKSLVGVDLAPRMIAAAKARGIYDELHVADVTAFLGECENRFDLIIAADLFIYVGDLAKIIPASARALRRGGWLVFSVEAQSEPGFHLQETRRYSHSLEYLRSLEDACGFEMKVANPVGLRMEKGRLLPGFAVVFWKALGKEMGE